jgi:hypothetical protein
LLSDPAEFAADDFIDLSGRLGGRRISSQDRVLLRLGLRSLGFVRLDQLVGPDAQRSIPREGSLRLPFVRGLESRSVGSPATSARVRVSGRDLQDLFEAAGAFIEASAQLPQRAPVQSGKQVLLSLVRLLDDDPPPGVVAALEGIAAPPGFEVSRAELLSLAEDALGGLDRGSLGGPGAGVALLSLREARARTFDRLFILGANRGSFPKAASDDPLLPERERVRLRPALPLLPKVGGDPAGERHAVAQLISASPSVTLVWQTVDAGGRAATPSPLVSYLLRDLGSEAGLPVALSALPAELPIPSPIEDYVMRAGLYGSREELASLLPLALASADPCGSPGDPHAPARMASARLGLLHEVDPQPGSDEGKARWAALGPFLGQVGAVGDAEDPRRRNFSARSLEGLATCPWQSFLTIYLGLKDLPDPAANIPQVDVRLVGLLVHQVLEDLVCDRGLLAGGDLADVLAREAGVRVPKPSPEQLAERCLAASRVLLRSEGLVLPGLAELLAQRAIGFIEQAFADGPLPPFSGGGGSVPDAGAHRPEIVGVEVDGLAEVAGQKIGFRADRVDRIGDELVFVDYKSGRALSKALRQSTRDRDYFKAVAQGRKLQAAIYSSACGPEVSRGRYVFLRPDVLAGARRVDHDASDSELDEALTAAVSTLASGLHGGQLFPRLVGPNAEKESPACARCSVSSACVRGDSSARGRLVRYAAELAPGEAPIFDDLWRLPQRGRDIK